MKKHVLPTSVLQLFNITTSEGPRVMTHDYMVTFYNTTLNELFDMPLEDLTLEDWLALVHPEVPHNLQNQVAENHDTSTYVKTFYHVKKRLGNYLWTEAAWAWVEQEGGITVLGTLKNVSEEISSNQYLSHIANHDKETGLYNRQHFLKNMMGFDEKGWLFVCCFTQLHKAQRRMGQEAFSCLVSVLVEVLNEVLSLPYSLYRIGVDTLVFTVEESLTSKQAMMLMMKVEANFLKHGQSREVRLVKRVGLGALPRSDRQPAQLLSEVFDVSEYARIVESPAMYSGASRTAIQRYFQIEDALGVAVEHRQIDIALQPIVDSATGNLVSYEALARWTHPVLGEVSPKEFIPMAEKLGCIHTLGLVVLEKACQFLSAFDKVHNSRPNINVNVSVQQLLEPTFVDDVMTVVSKIQFSSSRIVLEITESYLLESSRTLMTTLNILHQRGFKLSIDDFGAGMTAITGLFCLPLYQIKLDKALVMEAMRLPACLKLVSYLCEYGRSHDIMIVAEGVETIKMFDQLMSAGITYVQGFCLYRPCEPYMWLTNASAL